MHKLKIFIIIRNPSLRKNRHLLHILIGLFFFSSCGDSSQSKPTGEFITRKDGEYLFDFPESAPQAPPNYPWSRKKIGDLEAITKNHFRCRGGKSHGLLTHMRDEEKITLEDCLGDHGLPLKNNKEFIYPILIDLLNHLQKKTGKEVIITSGHRCPAHNRFIDPRFKNAFSKHQIGAEVNFYIQGLEKKPFEAVALLMDYYRKDPREDWRHFSRYEKETNVSTPPWYNREIFIKLFLPKEGRDGDNCHPYPYIGIQVRFDTHEKKSVTFSEEAAKFHFTRSFPSESSGT